MREMGYAIGRRHRDKLRRAVLLLLFAAPIALVALSLIVGGGALTTLAALVAIASAAIGVTTERWLFFAEAEHVAMLYYGRESA